MDIENNNLKLNNLNSYIRNLLVRYYDNDDLIKYTFSLKKNNILLIKDLNEYIYLDKNIKILNIMKKYNKKYHKNTYYDIEDPKLLKILSKYYNLNSITYEYLNNICVVYKKNKIKEYIYCDFKLIKKKYNYFKILYENINYIYETAFLIQIGNWNTFDKMIHYFENIESIDTNYYITIVEEISNEKTINLLKKKLKYSVILEVKNKGMDIGPFLLNLLYIRINNISHKYIIKIHTKTDDRFREHVLNHLIGDQSVILNNIEKLKNNKDIGMLTGTLIFNTLNNNSFFNNHMYYLEYISSVLFSEKIKKSNLEFAIGTFFYSKFEIFKIFDSVNIKFIYKKLNDLNTLDMNWYSIFYNLNSTDINFLEEHSLKNTKNFRNNLDLQNKTKCDGMRDFMIEHALERFFGYLCKKNNLKIIEV